MYSKNYHTQKQYITYYIIIIILVAVNLLLLCVLLETNFGQYHHEYNKQIQNECFFVF